MPSSEPIRSDENPEAGVFQRQEFRLEIPRGGSVRSGAVPPEYCQCVRCRGRRRSVLHCDGAGRGDHAEKVYRTEGDA